MPLRIKSPPDASEAFAALTANEVAPDLAREIVQAADGAAELVLAGRPALACSAA